MRAAGLLAVAVAGCGLADAELVGKWENGSGQYLEIRPDLTGILTQTATCSPTIAVALERDPYGAFALRIDPNQKVFFPEAQKKYFRGRSFCSSTGTKPMCNFCRVEGTRLVCEETEQEIVGSGVRVIHDCSFLSVKTTTTSTITDRSCGPDAAIASCSGGAT